ncbi:unnamed protein product [Macrosiphum euphorbiae]|uniref:Uncharacterized protein n=1 Tax=Macrosiphum euphorbiae TaxID=13131 RepID=A0AAV0XXT1_9HEMI|nr:unnamed protein product [Macrosiphum euphorbiae]
MAFRGPFITELCDCESLRDDDKIDVRSKRLRCFKKSVKAFYKNRSCSTKTLFNTIFNGIYRVQDVQLRLLIIESIHDDDDDDDDPTKKSISSFTSCLAEACIVENFLKSYATTHPLYHAECMSENVKQYLRGRNYFFSL